MVEKFLPLQFSKIMQFPLNPLQEHLLGNIIGQLTVWQLSPWHDIPALYTNKDSCMRPCVCLARFHLYTIAVDAQPIDGQICLKWCLHESCYL